MAKKPLKKTCKNPNCKKEFLCGHYGARQQVGSGPAHITTIKCPSCKGSGEKRGDKCKKCRGSKKIQQSCTEWYRVFWAQTKKPPRGIPPAAFSQIERAAKTDDPLRYAWLVCARESGLRKGELLGVTWADILDPSGKIRGSFELRGQWDDNGGFRPTKTSGSRIAFLLPKAIKILGGVERGQPQDRVFAFGEADIYVWFINLQKKLKIVNPETGYPYRVHDIRHSLGTELARGKGEKGLMIAKEVLGHKNIQTTIGYAQLSAADVISEAMKLRAPQ